MSKPILCTYRLQLHSGFTLDDAANLAGYLAGLGVSHVYASPYLQAAPGSTHGYDVVNHRRVNEELGGPDAHRRFTDALAKAGMSHVLDIVPNHMAIVGPQNPWWWDVLENGPSSRYATYFDVQWDPPEARHANQVLVPILGDHYGRVLEAGEICLQENLDEFTIHYFDNLFPVDPRSLSSLVASAAEKSRSADLAYVAEGLDHLPAGSDRASALKRYRDMEVLYRMLARLRRENPDVDAAVREVVAETNQDPDALDILLGLQNYRLTYWRMAARELGYRRFFDINTLMGLRMEDEEVFQQTHELALGWVNEGLIDGLRIDHPDGLRDPEGYLQRLTSAAPEGTWIVIEKILERDEQLPADWPVAGTTGYDFMNRLNGIFVDPRSERALTDFYERFTGRDMDFAPLALEKKRQVLDQVLGSDLIRLTTLLLQVIEKHRRYRDYPRNELYSALREVTACMPVYRTYVRAELGVVRPTDVEYVTRATELAKANRPDLDPVLIDFLRDLLLLRVEGMGELEHEFVMRFQQFTGPAMAKGVEDTTFYSYYRLVSLNEVGGSPGHYGLPLEEFHRACEATQRRWGRSMLSTSTHDTKRSEDVRARINVLSEIPEQWMEWVERWSEHNQQYCKTEYRDGEGRGGVMPDPNDEYLLYQTLVGAWPIDEERVLRYLEKAGREAKEHTSWTQPDEVYETAAADFARSVLRDPDFIQGLENLVAEIKLPARLNSLAQALIKLTAPGIPDIYQGAELWDYSLVDPDNRRPVDYELRARLLEELPGLSPEEVWQRAEEGLPKLWIIQRALALRRRLPEAFAPDSTYAPLAVRGVHAVGFLRGGRVAVIAPRWTARLGKDWGGTQVDLPAGTWRDELSEAVFEGGSRPLSELFARFPLALLVRQGGNGKGHDQSGENA